MRLKVGAWVCQGWGFRRGGSDSAPRRQSGIPRHAARVGSPGQDFGSLPGSPMAAAGVRGQSRDTGPGRRHWLLLVSEGHQLWNQERVLTIRRRLEVDLQAGQGRKEPLGHPKPVFFTTTFSPTSLAAGGGGSPGCRLVPLVSRRAQRLADWRSALPHEGFWRPPRHQVPAEEWTGLCVRGSVLPLLPDWFCCGQDPPPRARLVFLAAVTHPASLSSGGRTHLSKGFGIDSRCLPMSWESISSSPAVCTLGGLGALPPLFLPQAVTAAAVK